ncbi:MAG: isocitrate lyase/PEP mutase family protein [Firmicutes bacterium]|nr:isocitrate lyase/PEP mutase family protein [Bacillota bacterium]
MKKTTRLKQLILDPKVLIMPGAYDALSARIIERAGFQAVQASGYGIAASYLGLPDVGLLTMSEMLDQTRRIARAVDIPVMGENDTGFGNAINVYRTVREFEAAGVAGINLEDQVFPKRCGHMEGKEIIPLEEMIKKIEAALEARRDPDFIINARTDAIAMAGVEEAIRRGNAYAQAGADLIFVEAPRSLEEIRRVVQEIKAPVSINMLDDGKTPLIPVGELEKMGVARVSFPLTALFAAAFALREAMEYLREHRLMTGYAARLFKFGEFTDLVGLPKIRDLETRFLPEGTIAAKYGGWRT